MHKRVIKHNMWDYEKGNRVIGDILFTENLIFKNDTMFFKKNDKIKDTLILKWQYFSEIKVMDPTTKETGVYTMKGANWTDYIFK